MNELCEYWMVHRITDGYRPKKRHESLSSALNEIKRLTALHPEATFVILHSIGAFNKSGQVKVQKSPQV